MKRKPKDPPVLWSCDYNFNQQAGPCEYPLYTVQQDGRYFIVKYHGCCAVKSTFTLEEAKSYIQSEIDKFS